MKLSYIIIILLFLWGKTLETVAPKKPWTVLVYIAGDNDLYQYVDLNVQQMSKVGSNETANLLVYLCKHVNGQKKVAQKILVDKNKISVVAQDFNIDSGSYKTVIEACTWAFTEYPADHLAFIGWDHGSGPLNKLPRGVCYDFSTGHYLTDIDLRDAFQAVTHNILHKKIDIIGWDACLMASVELNTTLEPYADYIVASQQTIPGPGWNYTRAFAPFTYKITSPDYIARAWVAAYKQTYQPITTDYTLSAVQLADNKHVVEYVDHIAYLLTNLLHYQAHNSVAQCIAQAVATRACVNFDEGNYIDLDNFYANLLQLIPQMSVTGASEAQGLINTLKNTLVEARLAIKKAVVANAMGKDNLAAAGISIYFPRNKRIHASYYLLDWTIKHPNWLTFLRAYYNV